MGPGLRQLRLPCIPKRQVGNAFCHFSSFTVCPPAFFPNSVDLVLVAVQIKGRVDNREEKNREYRDADCPHARLPPKIRRRRPKPSEAQTGKSKSNKLWDLPRRVRLEAKASLAVMESKALSVACPRRDDDAVRRLR
jgi:hypothetical protein